MINPYDKRLSIILQGKYIPHSDENHDLSFDIPSTSSYATHVPSYATHMPTSYEEVDRDDVHAIHNDHEEGIWEH